jgi:DME family drug/metabolite transporter
VYFQLTVAAVAWGTGGFAASLLYQHSGLGPVAVTWWRFAIGALLMLAIFRRSFRIGPLAVLAGIGMAVSQAAYFASVAYSGTAVSTVITIGVSPLIVAAGEWLMLSDRVNRWQAATLAVAIGGLCLLVLGGGGGSAGGSAIGVMLALLSGATYAGVILVQRASGDSNGAFAGFVIGGVCLLPFALWEGIIPTGDLPRVGLLLCYLGAVPTALAYGLFFAALGKVKATTAAVVALLEPVTAAAIGVAVLGETLTLAAVVGGLVLLTAVAAYPLATRGSLIS